MTWRELLRPSERDRPATAIVFMLIGLAFLSFQDSWIKLASSETSFWQLQTLRSIFNMALLFVGTALVGRIGVLRPRRLRYVLLRSVFLAVTMIFFFSGAPFLSPAEMGAGLYTFPVFVTLLSGLVLGEKVGPLRLGAVAVAALGAILIVRPFEADFRAVQALPVGAGFFYACNVLTVRRYCRQESTFAMAFVVAIVFLLTSVIGIAALSLFPPEQQARIAWPFLFERWPVLGWSIIGMAFVASITNLLGNLSLVQAYQSAEPSWLAPIDYTYLAMAVVWGLILFGTVPDSLTIMGMILIAGAGLFTAWRERLRRA